MLPVLVEAFESDSKERRALALKSVQCCVGVKDAFCEWEVQNIKDYARKLNCGTPKTYGELWDAYRCKCGNYCEEQLEYLPEDEREEGGIHSDRTCT